MYSCPAFENEKYLLRFSSYEDTKDLVGIYGDKKALPFFNSDNCHGDNFYYKGLIKYVGVMLKGKMEVLTDQETKDMIWRKGDTMFYKDGVTDPDYCVLRFTAESGRYYCDLKIESFSIEQ